MVPKDGDYFAVQAALARQRASAKAGGRDSRVAGHLALAYAALARAKSERASAPRGDEAGPMG
ncbi:hypothetical protein [Sphingomicrobium astaxanthinifaciens]|uniref:hypothetical protein n=1 Tax=Sphingomicrobium astaxanthinifaciens TaxID=1227949 RepID=UPI001FCB952A|nr:hypothetical protein [Sphingomicrobium astaxanthinifaciens]MCJ7420959.1 hypothetical protein [Sphingomicrobium astaxanthinifaciens]